MAFLKKTKNREGKIYLHCAECHRENGKVKMLTVKSFGRLDVLLQSDSDPILTAQRWVEDYNKRRLSSTIAVEFDLNRARVPQANQNFGWHILAAIYKELGITSVINKYQKTKGSAFSIDKILQLLVFSRIIEPGSKSAAVAGQSALMGNWNIAQNDMDRGLDHFAQLKQQIQLQMHKSICKTTNRTGYLVFYDVTNYYFETDIDDSDIYDGADSVIEVGLRKRGPSKEHKPKPIVQMGLFVDANGIPISYELFPGNQTDPITYIPAIEQVKAQFGLERIITVADKAMNSQKNTSDASSKGDGWIFSQKVRGKTNQTSNSTSALKALQEFALDCNNWQYNSSRTFAKKSTIRLRKLGDGTSVQEKVVVTWREKYANRERIRREGAVTFAAGLTNPAKYRITCKKGGKRYLEMYAIDKKTGVKSVLHPLLDIDYDLVDYDAQFDGLNVLVTSEINMSDEEIIAKYGELWRIEDCFRVTKTELSARPVFVWTKDHIEAHFLTCFIALTLIRLLQYKTRSEMSSHRLIESIKSARAFKLNAGYALTEANRDFVKLLSTFDISLENEVESIAKINSIKHARSLHS